MFPKFRNLASTATIALALAGAQAAAQNGAVLVQGPSSSQPPYVVGVQKGVITVSIISVGDSVNLGPSGQPYRFVGIPDGLGVYDREDGTFGVFCNHELGASAGVPRAHSTNGAGAFVSHWTVTKNRVGQNAFEVTSGADLIQNVSLWDPNQGVYLAPTTGVVFDRFCAADLPAKTAWLANGLGFNGRLFMNGEESNDGRAWAHVVSGPFRGTSYELPRLGKQGWENIVANPGPSAKTVVIGTDDTTPGQVFVYVGQKQNVGNPVERAGLANGQLYGVAVQGVPVEDRNLGVPSTTPFSLVSFGDVSNLDEAALDALCDAGGVTKFLRPEDGAWNPANLNQFIFCTTDRFDTVKTGTGTQIGRSRLWSMMFYDRQNPALGGTIEMLLDGTESGQMYDNLTLDQAGHVLLQEDPGNQGYSARIWQYDLATDTLKNIARFEKLRFGDLGVPAVAPYTTDEESSGIVDATALLGSGWFVITGQAHYAFGDPELVQGGQLLALYNPDSDIDGVLDLNVRTLTGN